MVRVLPLSMRTSSSSPPSSFAGHSTLVTSPRSISLTEFTSPKYVSMSSHSDLVMEYVNIYPTKKEKWVRTLHALHAQRQRPTQANKRRSRSKQSKLYGNPNSGMYVLAVLPVHCTTAAAIYSGSTTAVPHLAAENVASARRAPSAQDLVGIIPLADTKKAHSSSRRVSVQQYSSGYYFRPCREI